jgi:hypothetical protein
MFFIKSLICISLLGLFILPHKAYSQIILNTGAKIVINGGTAINPVFMVLDTPPINPIITSGATDGIIMEAEYNRLQYNLSTATTSISVPYMSTLLEQIPLSLVPSAAGVGSGNIRFSAAVAPSRATGFNNLSYTPSDVTNMGALSGINNSAKTIDRFWVIDANAYSTKPTVTLGFTYIDAEWATNGGNTIIEANLKAQRFNNTININDWGGYIDYIPMGTINTAANTITSVTVSPTAFYRSWTLNDNSSILPIELLNFDATCLDNDVQLNWCTASELQNDFFTVETSTDAVYFNVIATIKGHGTSTDKNCYSYQYKNAALGNLYFRLKQTDVNGKCSYSAIITTNCDALNTTQAHFLVYPNPSHADVTIAANQSGNYYITNELGQNLQHIILNETNNYQATITGLSNGVYFITGITQHHTQTKKLLITN